jgi:hypothetical protein
MDPNRKASDFVEIYHADSRIAAQKIIDVILAPEGVETMVHDRLAEHLPGMGLPGGVYIAVPDDQREKAVGLLDEARENGFLEDEDGETIEPQ